MCRTAVVVLSTLICTIQMLVRLFMTLVLMAENLIRMIIQSIYNVLAFIVQMISLLPIIVVFLISSRLKCFLCGGGGMCHVNRGGTCDCLIGGLGFALLVAIFYSTGVLDKIFFKLGYIKYRPITTTRTPPLEFVSECSRDMTPPTKPLPPRLMGLDSTTSATTPTTATSTTTATTTEATTTTSAIKATSDATDATDATAAAATSTSVTLGEEVDATVTETILVDIEIGTMNYPKNNSLENISPHDVDYFTPNPWTTVLYYLV